MASKLDLDDDDVTVLKLEPGSIMLELQMIVLKSRESPVVSEMMAIQALRESQPIFTLRGANGEKIEFKLKEKIRVEYVDKVSECVWKFK